MHRSDEHFRCADGVKESLAHHRSRGHSLNMGDAGLGVLAVGVASQIRYGSRYCSSTAQYRVTGREPMTSSEPLVLHWYTW